MGVRRCEASRSPTPQGQQSATTQRASNCQTPIRCICWTPSIPSALQGHPLHPSRQAIHCILPGIPCQPLARADAPDFEDRTFPRALRNFPASSYLNPHVPAMTLGVDLVDFVLQVLKVRRPPDGTPKGRHGQGRRGPRWPSTQSGRGGWGHDCLDGVVSPGHRLVPVLVRLIGHHKLEKRCPLCHQRPRVRQTDPAEKSFPGMRCPGHAWAGQKQPNNHSLPHILCLPPARHEEGQSTIGTAMVLDKVK